MCAHECRPAAAILPFGWLIRCMGSARAGHGMDAPTRSTSDPVSTGVARAVKRATVRLPWRFRCLAQALAGRLMLMCQRVPSSLVRGVTKRMGEVQAHTWLIAGDGTVFCGGCEAPGFSPSVPQELWYVESSMMGVGYGNDIKSPRPRRAALGG